LNRAGPFQVLQLLVRMRIVSLVIALNVIW
jgi:hypothetical protein